MWLLALAGSIIALGCGRDAADQMQALAPGISPEMARHLVADNPEEFGRYCRDVGIKELIDARLALRRAIDFSTPEGYERSVRALMPHIGRLSEHLAADYGCVEFLRDDHFWMGLPADRASELGALRLR